MLIQKTVAAQAADVNPLEYIMSDATVDRYGDSIDPAGWQLDSFVRNPVALFGHDSKFIIGNWRDVRVEKGALRGRLELMEAVSDRLREVHAAVKAGILRAVSVGFRPLSGEPLGERGTRYLKSELVECSLVGIPANPNALAIAKALNLSADAKTLIFGKTADRDGVQRDGLHGEPADPPKNRTYRTTKMNLSQQIEAAQARLVELTDLREAHAGKFEDPSDMDDTALTELESLNTRISNQQRVVKALRGSELESAQRSDPPMQQKTVGTSVEVRRPFAAPAKKVKPGDLIVRAAAVKLLAKLQGCHPSDILRERYEDHQDTRTVFDVVTRTASVPATTTTTGWAVELVQTSVADFLETLAPSAVYPRLSALGGKYTFGRSGTISIPTWASTPTIAGSFVAQGGAIPVRQGALTAATLTPKKMAVISTFTREIAEHSTPQIEALIRDKINMDTAVSLDTVLLDATAASSIRPAGLRNGVTETAATSGGGFTAFVTDLKNHIAVLATGGGGAIRKPVILMNPANALSIGFIQNLGGDFPFEGVGLEGGNIRGIPVITSSTVTANMIITVDAADFASVTGDAPRFDMSDSATLHMEDTTPLPLSAAASPNTVAAPIRSLFQTDTMAIRMMLDVNWAMLRTGVSAWTSSVTW